MGWEPHVKGIHKGIAVVEGQQRLAQVQQHVSSFSAARPPGCHVCLHEGQSWKGPL